LANKYAKGLLYKKPFALLQDCVPGTFDFVQLFTKTGVTKSSFDNTSTNHLSDASKF
jgi:hypothetical protein